MIGVTSKVNQNREIGADSEAAMRRGISLVLGTMQRSAKLAAPTNTGMLRDSIRIFKTRPLPRFFGGIVTNLPYAIVMEEGVKPGRIKPPTGRPPSNRIPAISRWAKLKLGLSEAEARDAAYAIIWKHHRRGIKARRFFFKAAAETSKKIAQAIAETFLEIETAWNKGG